jgi:hypothetical protein
MSVEQKHLANLIKPDHRIDQGDRFNWSANMYSNDIVTLTATFLDKSIAFILSYCFNEKAFNVHE